jgi:hypothetical protein
MPEEATKKQALIKVHCNQCRVTTNHRVLKEVSDRGSDDEQGFQWSTHYDMLQCCGCDDVVLRRYHWFSEDPEAETSFFPPRASRWVPSWRWSLPLLIGSLLAEVYTALQANSLSLAMMGARAIIETAIIAKVGDHGNFRAQLDAIEKDGYVSKSHRKYLEAALDAGNASAHRAHRPDAEQMNTVMDIVENLLQSLFVLEKRTRKLQAAIPPRPALKKKPTK